MYVKGKESCLKKKQKLAGRMKYSQVDIYFCMTESSWKDMCRLIVVQQDIIKFIRLVKFVDVVGGFKLKIIL